MLTKKSEQILAYQPQGWAFLFMSVRKTEFLFIVSQLGRAFLFKLAKDRASFCILYQPKGKSFLVSARGPRRSVLFFMLANCQLGRLSCSCPSKKPGQLGKAFHFSFWFFYRTSECKFGMDFYFCTQAAQTVHIPPENGKPSKTWPISCVQSRFSTNFAFFNNSLLMYFCIFLETSENTYIFHQWDTSQRSQAIVLFQLIFR